MTSLRFRLLGSSLVSLCPCFLCVGAFLKDPDRIILSYLSLPWKEDSGKNPLEPSFERDLDFSPSLCGLTLLAVLFLAVEECLSSLFSDE
ncbi:unnamed protein product [Moneuplotes crassus]|uniref:Secreted protein n=1 Tax=Euplotes crassus TaxID=5936 RepID=A0AAD1UJS6_EUPCR|nr:unnamed protein product [Moneuplotes crassus]